MAFPPPKGAAPSMAAADPDLAGDLATSRPGVAPGAALGGGKDPTKPKKFGGGKFGKGGAHGGFSRGGGINNFKRGGRY